MANRRRDLAKERWWREVLARRAASGLSVREFCRRERLGEASFYAWRRTLIQRDRAPKGAAFVPVVVQVQEPVSTRVGRFSSSAASQAATLPALLPPERALLAIELRGGRTLRLPAAISPARLARIVQALEATGPAPMAPGHDRPARARGAAR